MRVIFILPAAVTARAGTNAAPDPNTVDLRKFLLCMDAKRTLLTSGLPVTPRLAGYCRPEHCLFRSDGRMLLVGGSPRMEAHAPLPDVERELQFRRGLTQITNHINSAESIQQILISVKEGLVQLLDCERLTIYALDTKNQVLYSIQKVGTIPKIGRAS